MMGTKERNFLSLEDLSLEELVPEDNFYRRLERTVDLSFIRELLRPYYASRGRPSIDPVVFFKLQLVMFFEGIRSERQLMSAAADRLSLRWYLGYDLREPLPDHSSLTKIRERYGLEVFRRFFEEIVELCVEAGLVWGEELYFDSTKVEANAAVDSLAPRWAIEAHLDELFDGDYQEDEDPSAQTSPAVAVLPTTGDDGLQERNSTKRDCHGSKREATAHLRELETEEAGSGGSPAPADRHRPSDQSSSGASFESLLAANEDIFQQAGPF
jgi:transposase